MSLVKNVYLGNKQVGHPEPCLEEAGMYLWYADDDATVKASKLYINKRDLHSP